MIGCLTIPDFVIAVERQHNPRLKQQPLIMTQDRSQGSIVYAHSPDLHAVGIHPGLKLKHAQLLAPDAHLLPMALNHYQRSLDDLVRILSDYANKIEPVRITTNQSAGIVYIEMGKLRIADARFLGQRLLEHVQERSGYSAYLGLAKSKFTALVAAVYAEDHTPQIITPDEEADFLAPKPISLLPVGKEMKRRLGLLGISTIGQFAALPGPAVFNQFGQHGQRCHRIAQGNDSRPVRPQKPVRRETANCQFEPPVCQRQPLEANLRQIASDLSLRLASDGLGVQTITLSLQLSGLSAVEDTLNLNQPFHCPQRLEWSLAYLLQRMTVTDAVQELTVYLTDLTTVQPRQLSLFDNADTHQQVDDILVDLVPRFGLEAFYDIHPLRLNASQIQRRYWLEKAGIA